MNREEIERKIGILKEDRKMFGLTTMEEVEMIKLNRMLRELEDG